MCALPSPQVRSSLPADLRDPVINKVNLAGSPVLAYTVRSPSVDAEALSWFVDNHHRPQVAVGARRGCQSTGWAVRIGKSR